MCVYIAMCTPIRPYSYYSYYNLFIPTYLTSHMEPFWYNRLKLCFSQLRHFACTHWAKTAEFFHAFSSYSLIVAWHLYYIHIIYIICIYIMMYHFMCFPRSWMGSTFLMDRFDDVKNFMDSHYSFIFSKERSIGYLCIRVHRCEVMQ